MNRRASRAEQNLGTSDRLRLLSRTIDGFKSIELPANCMREPEVGQRMREENWSAMGQFGELTYNGINLEN